MAFDDDNNDEIDLSMLSPEERAGLAEDAASEKAALEAVLKNNAVPVTEETADPDPAAAAAKAAEKAPAAEEEEEDPDLAEQERQAEAEAAAAAAAKQPDAAAAAAAAAAEAEAAAAKAAEPAAAAAPPDFQPVFHVPPVEDYEGKMAALNASWAETDRKWSEGEIPTEEKNAAFQKYLDERDALRSANDRYVNHQLQMKQASEQRWEWEQNTFKAQALSDTGIDYTNDVKMNRAWNTWVQHLAGQPENAQKSGMWFLEQAHKKVMVEFDIAPKAASAGTKPPAAAAPKPDTTRQPKLDNIPPTLGKLPVAEEGDTGKTEFAHMDGLEGTAYEVALARMSPEQQERYLNS